MATEMIWTLLDETPIPADVQELLAPGEEAKVAFKTMRDTAIFTNKRLIMKDAQGLTGKKVEMYSLPYSSIQMWSSENSGKLLDMTAELELWTKVGRIKINVGRRLDIRALDRMLSGFILG